MDKKVCILGGGASGLYCAMHIQLQNPGMEVTVLEKNARVGKKLLATGNGKCNFTNLNQDIQFYTSNAPEMAYKILQAHPPQAIMQAFSAIGVESTQKDGLVYPRSLQAASVLDALRFKAEALGIKLCTDFEVKRIKREKGQYVLSSETDIRADILVIASGSAASGGSASGIKLLRSLGHTATPTYPALVPVVCDTIHTKLAKGMRAQCKAALYKDNALVASEYGEVLFTDYGISGICIFQLSRHIAQSRANGEKAEFYFTLDLAPEADEAALLAFYKARRESIGYVQTGEFLSGFLNKKIGQAVLKSCGIGDFSAPASELSDSQLSILCNATKQFKLKVTDTLDAAHAQVCGGGIRLDEFTEKLASLKQDGLYACGEVLDVLGACGGYNLTWAWASAYAVACGITANT